MRTRDTYRQGRIKVYLYQALAQKVQRSQDLSRREGEGRLAMEPECWRYREAEESRRNGEGRSKGEAAAGLAQNRTNREQIR